MFSRTFTDVLSAVESFHEQLGSHYERQVSRAEREDVRAFLGLLSRKEKRFARSISRYRDRAARDVLDTWLQFPPEVNLEHEWGDSDFDPAMTLGAVSRLAVTYDQRLKLLLQALSDGAAPERLRDALQGLVDLEETKDLAVHDSARMN